MSTGIDIISSSNKNKKSFSFSLKCHRASVFSYSCENAAAESTAIDYRVISGLAQCAWHVTAQGKDARLWLQPRNRQPLPFVTAELHCFL